jgi:hypothetical protein
MNFIRMHWYRLGLIPGVAVLLWLAAEWSSMGLLQKLLAANFIVIMLHQFEEYAWPGGFPWICNQVLMPKPEGRPDRYVLNQNNAMFINIAAWPFYLIPALFPAVIGLGIGQMLFGLVGQVVVHGLVINHKLKTWYNPGLAAVMLGHVPIGIWYLIEVVGQGMAQWWDWVLAIIYMGAFMGIVMQVFGFRVLADPNSPYPFASEEMNRNDPDGQLNRAGITPRP